MARLSLRLIPLTIGTLLVLLASSCKHSPNGPADDNRGPRNYTWTVDTLRYPGSFQTLMRDIWASSPTDVYAVGFNDQGIGNMYHYDGKTWKPVPLVTSVGGQIQGGITPNAVFGFGPNDVWAVGERFYHNPTPPQTF